MYLEAKCLFESLQQSNGRDGVVRVFQKQHRDSGGGGENLAAVGQHDDGFSLKSFHADDVGNEIQKLRRILNFKVILRGRKGQI